jgi:hypothetical protein
LEVTELGCVSFEHNVALKAGLVLVHAVHLQAAKPL